MEKELNLKDKRKNFVRIPEWDKNNEGYYRGKDVQEFIRRLKENVPTWSSAGITDIIDKLSGNL